MVEIIKKSSTHFANSSLKRGEKGVVGGLRRRGAAGTGGGVGVRGQEAAEGTPVRLLRGRIGRYQTVGVNRWDNHEPNKLN